VGLDETAVPGTIARTARRARDPAFREAVLRAYERRCAVCGYDGRLGREDLALEAAHVRWHCYDGPDDLANGLALCTYHHTALDRGAIGIDGNAHILISADVHGTEMVDVLLHRHHGTRLRPPQPGFEGPSPNHTSWHEREVFRAPARGGAA
jgi:putative restriction endonuclease